MRWPIGRPKRQFSISGQGSSRNAEEHYLNVCGPPENYFKQKHNKCFTVGQLRYLINQKDIHHGIILFSQLKRPLNRIAFDHGLTRVSSHRNTTNIQVLPQETYGSKIFQQISMENGDQMSRVARKSLEIFVLFYKNKASPARSAVGVSTITSQLDTFPSLLLRHIYSVLYRRFSLRRVYYRLSHLSL